jgi:hypothetical protein
MKVSTGKVNLWMQYYWSVTFTLDEAEYDDDPVWALYLKSRSGVVPGVLIGVQLIERRPTPAITSEDELRVTIRATVMPLRKDGSFSVKSETIDFDDRSTERFARLPAQVRAAYRVFCARRDELRHREDVVNEETLRLQQALYQWWQGLFALEQEAS